jgi:hypothetical protein
VSIALSEIARDATARERYLAFARETDEPAVRVRMLALARSVGWLAPGELNAEYRRMIAERLHADSIGLADVNLACSLNGNHELRGELPRPTSPALAHATAHAAVLACLDSAEAHGRVLRALTSGSDADAEIAQVYFHHRPISDAGELRAVTASIARMKSAGAQVRALETLSGYRLTDRDSLDELARLFPRTTSVDVQRAIAGILIRGDYRAIARPEVVTALRAHRLKSVGGEDVRDVLIRRLQMSL